MKYWVFECGGNDGALIDVLPDHCPAKWRFNEGESLIREYPSEVNLKFSNNRPEGRKLYDFVDNIIGFIIASERVKAVVEQYEKNVEFLPVTIFDHKGNVAGENYYIINLLGSQPAVDMNKSTYRMDALEEEQMDRIKDFKGDYDAIDPEATFFREKNMLRLFLLRNDLHEAFVKEGFTGFEVWEAEGWDGLYI